MLVTDIVITNYLVLKELNYTGQTCLQKLNNNEFFNVFEC